MRFVVYHPLTARIGHHLREFVRFKSHGAYRKYHYFVSQYFNNKNRDVAIFLNSPKKFPVYAYLKCLVWMVINGINFTKVKMINQPSELDPKKDVLFSFPFLSFHRENPFLPDSVFRKFEGLKIFHFSHYFDQTAKMCSFFRSLKNVVVTAESNLQNNLLYQKCMDSSPFYVLPFALKARYQNRREFLSRKAKCLACGTKSKVCPSLHREFHQLFKANYLHELRGELHEKRREVEPWIESLIFDYYELNDFKPKTRWEQFSTAIRKKIGNDRKQFFSFDIVEKYNEYQMFVSPEEESGSPSISFIEGMACGCCYFGRPECYVGLGLIPGVHFVPYDGTLAGLIEKISYYQQHPELAAEIARNGQNFVQTHFKAQDIADGFWNFMEMSTRKLCESALSKTLVTND